MIPNPREVDWLMREGLRLAAMHEWEIHNLTRRWEDLRAKLLSGEVDIGIVDSRRSLPPDRLPRIEAIDEMRRRPIQDRRRRSQRARRLPPDQPR